MDLLVQLLVGVAWPLSIFGIVLLLRKDLASVIARLTKLRYKDLEAEFNETLRKIEAPQAIQLPPAEVEEQEAGHPLAERKKELYALAAASPRAAVLESWINLEAQIRRSAEYLQVEPKRDVLSVLTALSQKSKRVSPGFAEAVKALRQLRNVATHEPNLSLSEGEAIEYVSRALDVAASLDLFTNPAYRHHFRE